MNKILSIVFIYFFSFGVFGADAISKYGGYTPEQIIALPENIRRSEVPMTFVFAAQTGQNDLLMSMYLNSLMYSGLSDYRLAVKDFQKDLGEESTGVLTVSQISKLENRASRLKIEQIGFESSFYGWKAYGSATVKGTYTILGDEKIAFPINHTTISCNQQERVCKENQLVLRLPDEDSTYIIVRSLSEEIYEITNWGESTIDAKMESGCRIVGLNLNFDTEEHFQIVRNAKENCNVGGVDLDRLASPRVTQLVNGQEIFNQEFLEIKKQAYGYLSSKFRDLVAKQK
ncbi:MAG: hypothetical protein ACJ0RL_05320 [Porticoccaceae bacterium]